MEFPITSTYFTKEDALSMLNDVGQNASTEISVREERLSGLFIDTLRMQCRRGDSKLSPYDYWVQNRERIEEKSDGDKLKMDEIIFTNERGCSSFFPHHLIKLLAKYKPKTLLDPCGGWGERMIACIYSGVKYLGVDPNPELPFFYEKIKDFYCDKLKRDPKNYKLLTSRFEDVDLGENEYDMIYTSPPFWDIEIYSKDGNQSSAYASIEEWKTSFLFVLLTNAWYRLKERGRMFIYLADRAGNKKDRSYVSDMKRFMGTFPDAIVEETETYGTRNDKPVYVWSKKTQVYDETTPNFTSKGRLIRDPVKDGTKSRVIEKYLNLYEKDTKFVYVAEKFDTELPALISVFEKREGKRKGKLLDIYFPESDKKSFADNKNKRSVFIYKGKDYEKRKDLEKRSREESWVVIPQDFNDSEFKGLLYNDLLLATFDIPEPERLWLVLKSPVILQTLGRIWKKTTFCCSMFWEVADTETYARNNGFNYDLSSRMILYYNPEGKNSLDKMRKHYGFPEDNIFNF